MAKQNLGFVGTGRMGSRMVRRLIQAGHEVTIYDTSEAAVVPLVEIGAKRAASPAAVASAAEIVFASYRARPERNHRGQPREDFHRCFDNGGDG